MIAHFFRFVKSKKPAGAFFCSFFFCENQTKTGNSKQQTPFAEIPSHSGQKSGWNGENGAEKVNIRTEQVNIAALQSVQNVL
ncbi:MAG TPA: hypothetical protein DDW30_00660 [Clostridiales bacterium]|nr:hypothetical protein [Clostridiales bacterium]